MLMTEFDFELVRGAFVGGVIVAVAPQGHRVDVRARPYHVDVLAPVLPVHHGDAGLALKAQLLF